MNPIEVVERDIQQALPSTWTRLRRPRKPDGNWWLDAKNDDHSVTVQWSPRRGFGVTSSALGSGYGEGPEETIEDASTTTSRVVELFRSKGHTIPPKEVVLRELRSLLGVTQEQLAEKLGIQQAAISRFERREDITLSSLKRFVAALGAELEISIRLPRGESLRLSGAGETKERPAVCTHVESAPVSTRDDVEGLTEASCVDALAEFEQIARAAWSWQRPFVLELNQGNRLAFSIADGIVGLNLRRASKVAAEIFAKHQKTSDLLSASRAQSLVARFLVAHEVGHCVEDAALRAEPTIAQLRGCELRADAIAGWLSGRAGDDGPLGAYVAASLGCREAQCEHPSPEERSFAFLTGHGLATASKPTSCPSLSHFVVYAADLERSRAFYCGLGLTLQREKHGDGPVHYSCELGDTVVEFYPTRKSTGGGRVGLRVPSTTRAVDELVNLGFLTERPKLVSGHNGQDACVVRDPDGNAVALDSLSPGFDGAL